MEFVNALLRLENLLLECAQFGKEASHGGVTNYTNKELKLKRKFRKHRTSINFANYKQASCQLRRNLRQEKHEHMVKSINSMHEGNTKMIFSKFRSLNSNKISIIPVLIDEQTNKIAHADIDKVKLLVDSFSQPPQPPNNAINYTGYYQSIENEIASVFAIFRDEEMKNRSVNLCDKHQSEITESEVIEALRHISCYKAQGPDNIHNLMLKNGGDSILQSLVFLLGWSFRMGYMPKSWKMANIVPIPKPDRDHSLTKNYRPIALLSRVGKLMERIILRRLMYYLHQNNLLTPNQAGFQSRQNTDEFLLRITETIHKSFDKNGVTYAVLLDISAAYDSVWRNGLRSKLSEEFYLKGRLYWWIDSFLSDRVGRVVINGAHSEWKKFHTGVPQGLALYPLLFLLYINDIATTVPDQIQCGIFADDVAIWSSIFTSDTNEMQNQMNKMQRCLDNICEWANTWKMVLAPEKTQCITFRKKNKKKYPPLQLNLQGTPITETDNVRYLGLIMDSQLNYNRHLNYVYGKASRNVGYLTFLCSYKGIRPSLSVYTLLFKTIIRHSLEYACAFWNGAAEIHKKKLELIQRISMCRILGVIHATA
ncbi:hypothetical protein RFI_03948 [Reticulomyxa filosa]|uniref:Reverse transcriptase domain-containing protein n=1 Tax=Reticulomyxa filosa TaxID=46433 RepID=X6P6B8_RETFI|nr:hypothetical protein RFI_03948 [Reticulomyxa filosa]|eukprot:ETO33162.1 hypothetical protein RFI_03948 [Reticulomyxa filosa]